MAFTLRNWYFNRGELEHYGTSWNILKHGATLVQNLNFPLFGGFIWGGFLSYRRTKKKSGADVMRAFYCVPNRPGLLYIVEV